MAEVTLPRLSDTMSEGAVGRWLKKPGDAVENGDIIAEIETDKATMELQAFESGTLQKILVPEGQTVPIGEVIAIIGDGAAPAEEAAAPAEASPPARKLAAERGIDLSQVQGTGPGGRIIKENVESFQPGTKPAEAKPEAPAAKPAAAPAGPSTSSGQAEVTPMSRMRRAIARAMNDSKPGTPHIYVTVEIDMGAAMQLRHSINDSGAADTKISVNDLVVKAAAKALTKFPAVNSSYAVGGDNQPGVVKHPAVNVSVAVALEDGLIAPVITDADKKSIGTIAAEIKDMAGRARESKIRQNELEGATFQVTNLGMYGVVEFGSIITVPQSASLAVGAVRQVPVVRNGEIAVGEIMNVTLSADHRVVDGAVAAQYLAELRKLLEAPMSLLV